MLSSGKPTGLVPNIIGYNYNENKAQIEAILKAEGYELGSVSEEESDEPVGVIINQDPGAILPHRREVRLTLSSAKEPISRKCLLFWV